MRIKFGPIEIEIESKPEPKPETFYEKCRREHREFMDEADERWYRFINR